MYQRNRVLLFLTIISVVCNISPSFAEQIAKTAGAEGLNLKQLAQGLGELRQTLLKHQESISVQERQLANQSKVIAKQNHVLEQQNQELQYLRKQILSNDQLQTQRAAGIQGSHQVADARRLDADTQQKLKKGADNVTIQGTGTQQGQWLSQASSEQQYESVKNTKASKTAKDAGSKSQTKERPPEVAAIPEIGGVLTPRGQLKLEPGLQMSHSSFNRFTFLGVEIVDAFLVGLIQAEDTDRDLISPSLTARYGITNRLEAEVKVPYVYRSDEVSGVIPQIDDNGAATTVNRDFDGNGLGDIELALHYQINRGLNGWPFFIGNLRGKSTTGEGPFDVDRDIFGREDESPTGSGFYSLEPSLTILYPTDPAVFFANFGYLINFERDVNKTFVQTVESSGEVVTQSFGDVDPGDSVRISFGMGYALNERSSLTLGYKHDFIDETDFEINGATVSSNDLQVGSLLLGYGFALNPSTNVNLNLELGITQDAPDVLLTLRVPFTAYQF